MWLSTFSAGNPHAAFDVAGAGNVTMVAGLRSIAKAMELPPEPTVCAPALDPTCERLEVRPLRPTRPKNCPARQSRGFGTKYSQGAASANDHACPNCNAEAALSKDLQGTHIC